MLNAALFGLIFVVVVVGFFYALLFLNFFLLFLILAVFGAYKRYIQHGYYYKPHDNYGEYNRGHVCFVLKFLVAALRRLVVLCGKVVFVTTCMPFSPFSPCTSLVKVTR